MNIKMESEDISNLTNIQKFFLGQSVFITGVTGLTGKVILEKILRCCPGIGMVYIHIRPKKGLTPNQRADKLFNLELFRVLKDVSPDFRKHVQVVEGDITKPRLGLSFEDFEDIRQNVSIVINNAASVKFTDSIKIAVENNVVPTQTILDLCHEMTHIKAIVHVSTACVQREEDGTVLEEIPKCKIDPEILMEDLKCMDAKGKAEVENFLLDNCWGQFTTYAISKAMAEILIEKKRGDLPVAIVRPPYIGSTWKDPFPGWIDGTQGVQSIIILVAKGVLRTLYIKKDAKIYMAPLDVVANGIIASAWQVGTTRSSNIFILNCVLNFNDLPYLEKTCLNILMEKKDEYPLANIFRYPKMTFYHNRFLYQLHSVVDHWIPALIVDLLLYLFTGKTVLTRIFRRINVAWEVIYKGCEDPWIHRTDNLVALRSKLSEEDKKIFFIGFENFDWHDYLDSFCQGTRKFIAHEDPSNIPYAKKKIKIWWAITTTLQWLFIAILVYFFLTPSH